MQLDMYMCVYMCSVASIFVQGHMPIMLSVCITVPLITFLIPVSSYEIYIDIFASFLQENKFAYIIYVAFDGHICCWHIHGNSMVNKSYIF